MVIPAAASPDGAMYFGKNNNREPGECQLIITQPAVEHDANTLVKCTHITILQVPQRYSIVLSKPWWTWGGEMGANYQGVIIGCEALLTRDHESEPGLIGMDLVRLGLERGGTAEDALDVIISLLQSHGQGGACRYEDVSYSHDNSFIIADANEAWILETAGRHWAAKRVESGTILSSRLTLGTDYERSSYALPQYAQLRGWVKQDEEVHFADTFSCKLHTRLSLDRQLRESLLRGLSQLDRNYPHLGMMRLLRWRRSVHPGRRSKSDVALHAGGLFHRAQTTGSMVARVSPRRKDCFFTGTSAPDLSVFKPVHFGQSLDDDLQGVDLSRYHEESLWWRHEKLHRALLLAPRLIADYSKERDELERNMVTELATEKGRQLAHTRNKLREDLLKWEESWIGKVASVKSSFLALGPFAFYWKRQNRRDGIEL
ncbi:MAG: C69 family dipeptidase [Candidatus Neomarinimicrobiota bacterium]